MVFLCGYGKVYVVSRRDAFKHCATGLSSSQCYSWTRKIGKVARTSWTCTLMRGYLVLRCKKESRQAKPKLRQCVMGLSV